MLPRSTAKDHIPSTSAASIAATKLRVGAMVCGLDTKARAGEIAALGTKQRGGVLGQASVLTVSSYPTRTSVSVRGKYVLQNLLGAAPPPPPPPPDVPPLDEGNVASSASLREQMEMHRSNAVCASCHARMDPLGFGLENYDAAADAAADS